MIITTVFASYAHCCGFDCDVVTTNIVTTNNHDYTSNNNNNDITTTLLIKQFDVYCPVGTSGKVRRLIPNTYNTSGLAAGAIHILSNIPYACTKHINVMMNT